MPQFTSQAQVAIYWTNTANTTATAIPNQWYDWTGVTSASTTTNYITVTNVQPQWYEWNDSGTASRKLYRQTYQSYPKPVDPYANETPEEKAVRLEKLELAREKSKRATRRRRIRGEIAIIRAERLLREVLSEEQEAEYDRSKSFTMRVRDPKRETFRSFRVSHGRSGNIAELNERGGVIRRACIHPYGVNEPAEDTMAAQKLMLETDLEQLERVANWSR